MKSLDLLEVGGARRTPMIHQSEASECGLACLAMVAGRHGLKVDMSSLRRRFSPSLKGTTLKGLMKVAGRIGFAARPLRGEIEQLEHLSLPAILHWDLNHFVVLTKVSRGLRGRRFYIHDPALGERSFSFENFSRHFTGVVLELIKAEGFRRGQERSRLRIGQLWSKMSGLWGSLRQVLLLSVVLQLAALAMPFYLQLAIDTVLPGFDAGLLAMLAVGFGGLTALTALTAWLRAMILISLSNSLSYQVVTNLYRHLLRLPLPWFEKRHVGDILSRFGSTAPISHLLSQGLIAGLIDGAMSVTTLLLMAVYSPRLAAIAFAALIVVIVLRTGFVGALKNSTIDAVTAAARENTAFIESVRGIAALKAFGQEENRQRLWQQTKATAVNASIKLARMSASFDSGTQVVLAFERILFVYVAVSMAMKGEITVGMIFAFQIYKQQFLDSATRLVEQAINYRMLDVHLNRISDIALAKPEAEASGASPDQPVAGAIELRDVRFRYGEGETEVLKGVTLKIEPGEMVALVGPSGGGKTTLLKILMGLFEPTSGEMLVDGRPLDRPRVAGWRRRIGSVAQDDVLYAGSLCENIAFFDPEIDMERVMEVARLAYIHDDIAAMPMGYETLVGDMGSALSGGQRQRVLLARALYPKPVALFIDEGTAHLDPAAEAAVMDAIAETPITRVFSAHRPRAAEAAGRVFVVQGGQVSERRCADQFAGAREPWRAASRSIG
jgi:ATP-binding cassette subfamily B protein RaxB